MVGYICPYGNTLILSELQWESVSPVARVLACEKATLSRWSSEP